MNDGRIAASRDIVEVVTQDNFNLVWATIDWAIHAERFRLTPEAIEVFRRIPHESQASEATLPLLDSWMEQFLRPETRRRIFAEIRRAQFEAAKGAVQITIAGETHRLLHGRKKALFGPNRGSMEVTIRHLLEVEQRALPWQAFRLLEAFRQRHSLTNLTDAVRMLIDNAELGPHTRDEETTDEPSAPPQPTPPLLTQSVQVPQSPTSEPTNPDEETLKFNHPAAPVWDALVRCWTL